MALPSPARPHTARRMLAGLAIAAFAFTGCNLTSGEATVEANAPVDPPTATTATPALEPTTAPIVVAAPTSTPVPQTESTRGERAESVPTEEVTVEDAPVEAEPADDAPTSAEEPTDAASEPAETDTTDFNITSGGDCVQGVWESLPGQYGAYIDQVASLTGAPLSASGVIELAFEDGLYIYSATTAMSIDVDGFQTFSFVDGITRGSYEITNGFVVAEQTWAEIDAYVELPDGTRLDAGILGEEFNELAAFHEVPFDCTGPDTITMHFETQPGSLRYPMQFTRRI